MSTHGTDVSFDFTFPSSSTPPSQDGFTVAAGYSFDSLLVDPFYDRRHVRSPSRSSSIYSAVSTVESTPDSICTRRTTPSRASPSVRHHGPVLLPRIRPQDQHIDESKPLQTAAPVKKTTSSRNSSLSRASSAKPFDSTQSRSSLNQETMSDMAYAHLSSLTAENSFHEQPVIGMPVPVLAPPISLGDFPCNQGSSPGVDAAQPDVVAMSPLHSSTYFNAGTLGNYGHPSYHVSLMPPSAYTMSAPLPDFGSTPSYAAGRGLSPLSHAGSPEPSPTPSLSCTTLINYLMGTNPAASLVRTISFPARDPNVKHFWWDVRNIRPWNSFNAQAILALPGASALLTTPVPRSALAQPRMPARDPETEASLHSIYGSYYLPKLNSALAMSSSRPIQFSIPSKSCNSIQDLLFVADAAGGSSTAATIFGGKPTARVVGLVRSFDRFNTGMRVEGNIKRVEYLRGLAALHYAMREHSCRYGFILTEIELVLVRCGTEPTPFFGSLEVTSVQLSATAPKADGSLARDSATPLTACLALWGLCQLAGDETPPGHAHWRAEIGAPAEGTRRKAKPRDSWMPQPQLAEKREAKRSRGWIWPEDVIGRKELGKRGVKYGGI